MGERGLALYEESQVDAPYTGCEKYDNLILVPDGNAGRCHEYPLWKPQSNGDVQKIQTYMWSTINNKEAERAR